MEIRASFIDKLGRDIDVVSTPIESEVDFKDKKISGARAYCFCKDRLVVVCSKGVWNIPGGGIEEGEEPREAVRREVQEESNMKVIKQRFIFLQIFLEEGKEISRQTLSVCLVEPYGDFLSDPDEDITETKLIDPKDYKQYFDWGDRGDALIKRALEVKAKLDLEVNYIK